MWTVQVPYSNDNDISDDLDRMTVVYEIDADFVMDLLEDYKQGLDNLRFKSNMRHAHWLLIKEQLEKELRYQCNVKKKAEIVAYLKEDDPNKVKKEIPREQRLVSVFVIDINVLFLFVCQKHLNELIGSYYDLEQFLSDLLPAETALKVI